MSFYNPKYLRMWREALQKRMGTQRRKKKVKVIPKMSVLYPTVKTKARSYMSYLREWLRKKPIRDDEAIRMRIAKAREERERVIE